MILFSLLTLLLRVSQRNVREISQMQQDKINTTEEEHDDIDNDDDNNNDDKMKSECQQMISTLAYIKPMHSLELEIRHCKNLFAEYEWLQSEKKSVDADDCPSFSSFNNDPNHIPNQKLVNMWYGHTPTPLPMKSESQLIHESHYEPTMF